MISGLDREIVYAHGWAVSVVLVLDGSFWVGRGRDPPFDVILVFPYLTVHGISKFGQGLEVEVGLFDGVGSI